jgi:hypothetical protein
MKDVQKEATSSFPFLTTEHEEIALDYKIIDLCCCEIDFYINDGEQK